MKITLIGTGLMADCHARALKRISGIELAGVLGRNKTRAELFSHQHEIKFVADSVEDLYTKTKAKGVVVAVSETSTVTVLREALKYPWLIFVEKPVGLFVSQARNLDEQARKLRRTIYVALNRRNYPSVLKARQILDEQAVGQRLIQVIDQEDTQQVVASGADSDVLKNWRLVNSIHLIDTLNYLARGEVIDVQNTTKIGDENLRFTHSIINYDSGDVALYTSIWNGAGPWSLSVNFSDKRIELRPLEQITQQIFPSRAQKLVGLKVEHSDIKAGFFEQAREFHSAINGCQPRLATLSDYINSATLVDRLYDYS